MVGGAGGSENQNQQYGYWEGHQFEPTGSEGAILVPQEKLEDLVGIRRCAGLPQPDPRCDTLNYK